MKRLWLMAPAVLTVSLPEVTLAHWLEPGDDQRQPRWSLDAGASWENSDFEDVYYYSFSLKKPGRFFGLPSFHTIEFGGMSGRECHNQACTETNQGDFDTPIVGLSEELVFFHGGRFSISLAIGAYVKDSSARVGSAFTFGERLAVNVNLSGFQIALFARHFSNGSLTDTNEGHDFVGLSLSGHF